MPYVGEDVQTPRKRRWDNDKDDLYRVYPPEKQGDIFLINQHPDFAPRKILPLSKRARITTDEGVHMYDDLTSSHRTRNSLSKLSQDYHEYAGSRLPPKTTGSSLLPCHICHRRPTKKSDLDSFADCEGCGERTCFVCIRQCAGWGAVEVTAPVEEDVLSRSFHMDDVDDMVATQQQQGDCDTNHNAEERRAKMVGGLERSPSHPENDRQSKGGWTMGGHRAMVCSRCCVEKGAEGEVACLGCLSRMEGV
ncbi:hypothetical protein HJFPF1_00939 [Paramyrothecium foliicola]|nr:hypothetical protein HJFPF1_00939 [Paramyrothecium foliicola]